MGNINLSLSEILDKFKRKQKYIHYDFQELGLMLAQKLEDVNNKSLYIKLAKYEYTELLLEALTYSLYSTSSNKAKIFMWKLKELRENKKLRVFVGIFPILKTSHKTLLNDYEAKINDLLKEHDIKEIFYTLPEKLHITLFFIGELPAYLYYPLSIILEKYYKQKQEYWKKEITAQKLRIWQIKNNRQYIILDKFNNIPYRLYNSLKKFVLDQKSSTKYYNELVKLLIKEKRKFYPHMTFARIKPKNNITQDILKKLDFNINFSFKFCLTIVVSNFYKKFAHYTTYYSLNYAIGECWNRKNL